MVFFITFWRVGCINIAQLLAAERNEEKSEKVFTHTQTKYRTSINTHKIYSTMVIEAVLVHFMQMLRNLLIQICLFINNNSVYISVGS